MSMTFLTVILFQDRQRLTLLIWVIAFSIGYYGIKGGAFGLLTGGENRVWGPADSFIADNNALAMALLMILPLIRYLQLHSEKRWIRLALLGTIPLLVVSIFASYSRGAFLGLAITSLYLAAKSRHRIRYGLLILVALVGALSMMPDKFFDRMNTIETYDSDGSAQGRLASWEFGLNVAAAHPILGGGFRFTDAPEFTARYAPPGAYNAEGKIWNMHSIYFEVLATQGYVGLLIFLTTLFMAFRANAVVVRRTKSRPDLVWLRDLAAMTQVSLVAFATAGTFQNLAFFDLIWHVIAISAILRILIERELAKPAAEPNAAAAPTATSERRVGKRPLHKGPAPARGAYATPAGRRK
jgi:probable O-glycosylation ligase (exosortase A-associated)